MGASGAVIFEKISNPSDRRDDRDACACDDEGLVVIMVMMMTD